MLQTRIDQINKAEIFWQSTAYPAIRKWFADVCSEHLAGKKVFKADGKLSKVYEAQRVELTQKLEAVAPKGVYILLKTEEHGFGCFHTLTMTHGCRYIVVRESGDSVDYAGDWYCSLDFTQSALDVFLNQPPLPEWEPLTVEGVLAAYAEVKQIDAAISELKDKKAALLSRMGVLK